MFVKYNFTYFLSFSNFYIKLILCKLLLKNNILYFIDITVQIEEIKLKIKWLTIYKFLNSTLNVEQNPKSSS